MIAAASGAALLALFFSACAPSKNGADTTVEKIVTLEERVKNGDPHGTFLVVTEPGIIHQMKKAQPLARFRPLN